MHQKCVSAGDQAAAEQWRLRVKDPGAIQERGKAEAGPAVR